MRDVGVYPDVSEDDYHADEALSASGAKLLVPPSCPAKFREAMDNPKPPTKTYDYGHLAHFVLLGVGQPLFVMDPAIHGLTKDGKPSDKPGATSMWKDADAAARARGELPVSVDDHDKAQLMAKLVRDDPIAGPLFEAGNPEFSLWADDPTSGLRLRARPDWMTMRDGRVTIVEYKTAEDASPDRFGARAHKYGYHIQQAWYWKVARLLEIDDNPDFLFVVQEKTPPYLVSVIRLDDRAFLYAVGLMARAIETFLMCTEANAWHGYGEQIHTAGLPPWAYNNDGNGDDDGNRH